MELELHSDLFSADDLKLSNYTPLIKCLPIPFLLPVHHVSLIRVVSISKFAVILLLHHTES